MDLDLRFVCKLSIDVCALMRLLGLGGLILRLVLGLLLLCSSGHWLSAVITKSDVKVEGGRTKTSH